MILAEPEAPFWGFGEILTILALAVVCFAVVGSTGAAWLGDDARLGHWAVLQELIAYLLIFAGIKIIFFWQGHPLLRSLGFVRYSVQPLSLVYTGFALIAVTVFFAAITRTPDIQTPFQEMLSASSVGRIVIALFGVTVGPMVEELLFRGFLQPVLTSAAGVLPGILITSLVFGALHLAQNANLWQTGVVITIAGFGFGTVRHLTGSTRASTITHMAYNSLPFLLTVLQPDNK